MDMASSATAPQVRTLEATKSAKAKEAVKNQGIEAIKDILFGSVSVSRAKVPL
jgi:hypothetical protein